MLHSACIRHHALRSLSDAELLDMAHQVWRHTLNRACVVASKPRGAMREQLSVPAPVPGLGKAAFSQLVSGRQVAMTLFLDTACSRAQLQARNYMPSWHLAEACCRGAAWSKQA